MQPYVTQQHLTQQHVLQQHVLPSVFDRLFLAATNPDSHRFCSVAQFFESVRRDLELLLNTRTQRNFLPAGMSAVRASVASYGVDYLSPHFIASVAGQQALAQQLATSIARFEPRLRSVSVTALDTQPGQRLRFRIEAHLYLNSLPEHIVFDSALEPVSGTLSLTRAAS